MTHVAKASVFPREFLLLLFIIVDTGQALVMDWAEKRTWMEHRTGRQSDSERKMDSK